MSKIKFKKGLDVTHKIYGKGTIVDYVNDKQIYVRFENQSDEDVVDYDDTELTLIEKFNIKKKGNSFVAFDTEDNKRSYGRINITTGKFTGDTRCMIALHQRLDTFKEGKTDIVDLALERIKLDVESGDMTAIDEMLKFLPTEVLTNYLAED